MLGYVMVGTNDVEASIKFYDAVLTPLGLVRDVNGDGYAGYSSPDNPEVPELYLGHPFNGGTDEGKPGPRPTDSSIHYAYLRDPDGNKICAYFDTAG